MFPDLNDYNSNDIRSLFLYSWHFELFGLKELIDNTNRSISEKIKNNIEKSLIALDDFYEHDRLIMEVQMYHKIIPLAFQSYVLTLYSIVEASFERYCKMCEQHMKLKVKLEDIKDKGVTRAVNYLEKVIEVENIKSDSRWGKFTVINSLRNDLIHYCGIVSKKSNIGVYSVELGVEVIDGKIYITYDNIINIYKCIEAFMEFVFTRNFTIKEKSIDFTVEST